LTAKIAVRACWPVIENGVVHTDPENLGKCKHVGPTSDSDAFVVSTEPHWKPAEKPRHALADAQDVDKSAK
jgi:hypothetical protein